MEGTVAGVVLAAGAAERMGKPKLLLPFRQTTVLNATLAAVESSNVDRVIVVTGANADEVESSIVANRATVVRNSDYRRGNMSSFLTATATDPEAAAFILVPGDIPTIRADVIDLMVGLWRETDSWAAVTSYADGVGHPFLVSRDALDSATRTPGEKVLGRLLIESDDDRVVRVVVPITAPRDVNTPADYGALQDDEG
jgi:molybdenum cofactor cytidylyltransferase